MSTIDVNTAYTNFAQHICEDSINEFRLAYKKYLKNGTIFYNWCEGTGARQRNINELINWILSDDFYWYSSGLDGRDILIKVSKQIEREIKHPPVLSKLLEKEVD